VLRCRSTRAHVGETERIVSCVRDAEPLRPPSGLGAWRRRV